MDASRSIRGKKGGKIAFLNKKRTRFSVSRKQSLKTAKSTHCQHVLSDSGTGLSDETQMGERYRKDFAKTTDQC